MSNNEYELLDSGDKEKLERFGNFLIRRPDPEALWEKSNGLIWEKSNLAFKRVGSRGGNWKKNKEIPDFWQIVYGGFKFKIIPTSFKHLGLFPEQLENWEFVKKIKNLKGKKVLNLFGYTGGVTFVCARSGMKVTHVDASKPVVVWAKENAILNNLDENIRWIVDDALDFVKKEIRRGEKYDAIIMDPPAFGRGPNGEVWKIEEDFLNLFGKSLELLSNKPEFFIISGYASGYSKIVFENNLKILQEKFGGKVESLELLIKEKSDRGFLLPAGVTARWKK